MAETFSQGNVPWHTNTERQLEAKILNVVSGGGGGGGGTVGTGSPEGVVTASPGASYFDITTPGAGSFWYKRTGTGNTGWEQLIA